MNENEHPEPVVRDKRSSSGHKADFTDDKTYEKNRNRLSNARWAPGQDPRDDDAYPDSGWEYVNVETHEPPKPTVEERYAGMRGPDSGIKCWNCHVQDYRIVDERTGEEVAAARPEVEHALAMNREVDPALMPNVWLLICPGCFHKLQMPDYEVRRLQTQAKVSR